MTSGMSARIQAFVLLGLVATSGALAGVVGDRLITERRAPAAPDSVRASGAAPPGFGPWRWEARPDAGYAERLAESLSLTPAQETAISDIVAEEQRRVSELTREVQPQFRAIAQHTRSRIEDVLTAEQRERLGELREQRARFMGPGRDGGRMGPPRGNGMGPMGPMGPIGDSALRERRDSMARQRRDEVARDREAIMRDMRARRDSVMRQLRTLPPEMRDSIIEELRATRPERRDSLLRLQQQRMRERADSTRHRPPVPDTTGS
jgi:Spy/CpxP family protein refolding chaperone